MFAVFGHHERVTFDAATPGDAMPRSMLSLARTGRPHIQRTPTARRPARAAIGNRATGRLLDRAEGLRVGPVADRFEVEAKGHAGRAPVPGRRPYAPGLRDVGPGGGGRVSDDIAQRIRGATGGQPLPRSISQPLEAKHRTGLGGIRVHTGPEAEALTGAVGARAMTLDHNIFYGRGASPKDMGLTSEEVVHTMQQGAVPTSRSVGRAPKGVIQRDVSLSGKGISESKFQKNYYRTYDDVAMTGFKVMTPDSKKRVGTSGLFTCAGLVVAAKTGKGWVAGVHHMAGGSGDLPKAYKTLKGMVDEAAMPYGTVTEEVRYCIPGTATHAEKIVKFEKEVGTFDNDWRALAASYESGLDSIAVTLDLARKWHEPDALRVKFWKVEKAKQKKKRKWF